jgi:hypothetical protein
MASEFTKSILLHYLLHGELSTSIQIGKQNIFVQNKNNSLNECNTCVRLYLGPITFLLSYVCEYAAACYSGTDLGRNFSRGYLVKLLKFISDRIYYVG